MRRAQALSAIGAAAALGAASRVSGQTAITVKLGAIMVDDFTPALYAQQAGLFRRAGLNVQFETMSGGAATAAAVLGGSIDIAISNMVSTATAHERKVPLLIASLGSAYNTKAPSVLMIVANDSPIKSARDLAGKTVASSGLRDLNMTTAVAWIEQNGGDPSTMRQVELPYPVQLAAIDTGRIDVAILLAPFSQEALGNPKYRVLAHPYDAVGPSFANGIYIATSQYIAANADTVLRFARVLREAAIYSNAHHAETAPLLAQASGLALEKIQRGTRATYFESLDFQRLQIVIDFLAKYKILAASFPAQELIAAPTVAAWR